MNWKIKWIITNEIYIDIPLFIISFSACTFETPKVKIVSNEDLDCNI